MLEALLIILFYSLVIGAIGFRIGQRRNRPRAGLVWALLLGPLGWLLVYFGPDGNAAKTKPCPYYTFPVPLNAVKCAHCANQMRWLQGRPFKLSREVTEPAVPGRSG